jgi:hypothetical protein
MMTRELKKTLRAIEGIVYVTSIELELYVQGQDRYETEEKTEALKKEIQKLLPWGGFQTGYGSWILREGYTTDGKDYCDISSTIHY